MALVLTSGPAIEPVTLAEAKAHLRVDGSAEDTLIASLIITSRLHIEAALGLALITQSWSYFLDAWPPGNQLALPLRPVQSIAAVKLYAADEFGRHRPRRHLPARRRRHARPPRPPRQPHLAEAQPRRQRHRDRLRRRLRRCRRRRAGADPPGHPAAGGALARASRARGDRRDQRLRAVDGLRSAPALPLGAPMKLTGIGALRERLTLESPEPRRRRRRRRRRHLEHRRRSMGGRAPDLRRRAPAPRRRHRPRHARGLDPPPQRRRAGHALHRRRPHPRHRRRPGPRPPRPPPVPLRGTGVKCVGWVSAGTTVRLDRDADPRVTQHWHAARKSGYARDCRCAEHAPSRPR